MIARTSAGQDREFLESVVGSDLLENALSWISENLEPDDIFSTVVLETWAENHGFVLREDS